MTKTNRIFSLLLAVSLLACLALPAAGAVSEDTVTISSAEDLISLSRRCALDVWSQNKTVILTADLDLKEAEFVPIPTFGGTFLGQGHTISNLSVTAYGSNQGLFRYLQPGAVVRDLTVKGTVAPEGSRSNVGGIVGSNAGTLENCAFHGAVLGESCVGGIAGRNEAGGAILNCAVSGAVTGDSATGGVAGKNYGLVMKCVNHAGVNLTHSESELNLMAEDAGAALAELVSADDEAYHLLSSCSDTGGIVGWSGGVVQSCTNNGSVGYPHVGYNTGGIAGRQSGYLAGCVNNGAIHGRKDVGGIVGQAEPYLVVEPGRDTLEQLRQELNTLDRLINRALDDVQRTGDGISARLEVMGGHTDSARDSSKRLLDRVTDFTDDTVGTVNLLIADMTNALDQLSPALDDLSDVGGRLEQLSGSLGEALDSLDGAVDTGSQAMTGFRSAVDGLRQGQEELSAAADSLRRAADTLAGMISGLPSLPSWDDLNRVRREIGRAFDALREAGDSLDSALSEIQRALDRSGPLADDLGDALDQLQDASSSAAVIGRLLDRAFDTIGRAVDDLTKDGPTEFTPLGEEARQASDDLFSALAGLSEEMKGLNQELQSGGDTMTADLRAISRQFNVIFTLLIDTLSDFQDDVDAGIEGIIQDTSEEDIAATREGKVADCRNTGAVEGDRNVGGVAGAMSVEVDLDPEDDIMDRLSFGATYETKAVLQNCLNRGPVTAKKDCAGGLLGRMDLGTALDCQSYGPVTSTGGDYVGGVAGWADASIRACYGKNILSGGSYIGGIAGWASSLRDCCAIATIAEGTEYLGAVAGCVKAGGTLTGNRFVDTGVAGVDGVSYAGRAEPVPFEELDQLPGVPAEFTAFTLSLMADGTLVAQIPFFYGDDLSRISLPDVPEREGSYGSWPEFDLSGTRSDLTVEAVYNPWVTLAASEEMSGRLALALAEGQFTLDTVLHVSDGTQAPPPGGPENTVVWEISLTGSGLRPEDTVPLRLLSPAGGEAAVWQYQDGRWERVDAVRNGQYLMLTMRGTAGTFCLQPQGAAPWLMAVSAAAAAVLILFLVVLGRARRRKHTAGTQPGDRQDEQKPAAK